MKPSTPERRAWHMALVGLALHASGNLAGMLLDVNHPLDALSSWRLVNAATSTTLVALLLLRRVPPVRLSTAAVLVACATTLPLLWVERAARVAAGETGAPFDGLRTLVLLAPLLVPGPAWVSAAVVGAAAAEMMALAWWFDWSLGRALFPEPWSSLVIVLIALVVLAHRSRWQAAEQLASETKARAELMERLAHMALAARDLSNTPLQTLELGLSVAEAGQPLDERALGRMRRALFSLCELSALLERYEGLVPWKREDLALDARERLEHLAAELPADPPPARPGPS